MSVHQKADEDQRLREMIAKFLQLPIDDQWQIIHLGMSMLLRQRGIQPLELDIPVELQVREE